MRERFRSPRLINTIGPGDDRLGDSCWFGGRRGRNRGRPLRWIQWEDRRRWCARRRFRAGCRHRRWRARRRLAPLPNRRTGEHPGRRRGDFALVILRLRDGAFLPLGRQSDGHRQGNEAQSRTQYESTSTHGPVPLCTDQVRSRHADGCSGTGYFTALRIIFARIASLRSIPV